MSVTEGMGKTLGQAAIIGGLVLGLYLFRNQIGAAVSKWFGKTITDPITGAVEDAQQASIDAGYGLPPEQMNEPIYGKCSTGWNWLFNVNGCRDTPSTKDVGILAPPSGGTPFADLVNGQTPAYVPLNEPPAPVENYVVGSAQEAYDNAQAILAAHPVPSLIRSYNDVRAYDTNQYRIPAGYQGSMVNADLYNPATGEYLDISPYGWVVYKQDYSTLAPSGWANKRGSTGFGGLTHELPQWR